jgi:beta-lactamase superfamily II metal-dependent hydrolase
MQTRYVATDTAKVYATATARNAERELLWGDRVVLDPARPPVNGRIPVTARGLPGHVKPEELGDTSLLEFYFIDVGQGDGVLIRTPDDRHLMMDGGFTRSKQPTGKNAADFVDWKFTRDYGRSKITLDAMIASHNDADHYGGLWDLLNPAGQTELKAKAVEVKTFYTAGVGWFTDGTKRSLGRTVVVNKQKYLTDLLHDRTALLGYLQPTANPRLQGEWAAFMQCVANSQCAVKRLSNQTPWLGGFGPGQGPVGIRVLGPIESTVGPNSVPALRWLGGESESTNGNSLLLRVDYGHTRILLTGDLNSAAQADLLARFAESRQEFACDITKACHHGSDDCSVEFLRTLSAGTTIISSGDSEGFGHPRPAIVAASALTGNLLIEKDRIVTPLIYSTEIARSYRLGLIKAVEKRGAGSVGELKDLFAKIEETSAGALNPVKKTKPLGGSRLVSGVVYGLVNVRTDGRKILCATLNETDRTWDVRTFTSRF